MEVINNKKDELTGTVIVKVDKNDYQEEVDKRLKEIRKTAHFKGFRPGKVPLSLIRRIYGTQVIIEEVSKKVDEALKNFVKENNLSIIGDFIPVKEETDFDPENKENFQFKYEYGATSTPFINYEQLQLPYYKIELTEQTIEEAIKDYRKKFGEFFDIEQIEKDDDVFYVTLVELDENNQVKEDGLKKDNILLAFDLIEEEVRDLFKNKKINDEFNIKLSQLVKDPKRRAAMLNISEEKLSEISDNFKVIITKVRRFKEAELNQDLFKKVFPNKEITDLEQFKEEIKRLIEEEYKRLEFTLFKSIAFYNLMESVEVKIPEDFLFKWIKYNEESKPEDQRRSDEELKKLLPEVIRSIKWRRIVDQIIKDLDVKIETDDILNLQADKIKDIYIQFGIEPQTLGEAFFKDQAASSLKEMDNENIINLSIEAAENKAIEALKDKIKIEEKLVTQEMFDSILKEYEKKLEVKQEDSEAEETEGQKKASDEVSESKSTEEQVEKVSEPEKSPEKSQEQENSKQENKEKSE